MDTVEWAILTIFIIIVLIPSYVYYFMLVIPLIIHIIKIEIKLLKSLFKTKEETK